MYDMSEGVDVGTPSVYNLLPPTVARPWKCEEAKSRSEGRCGDAAALLIRPNFAEEEDTAAAADDDDDDDDDNAEDEDDA